MSNPLGKLGHLGIAKEATFGTPVGATDYLKFSTESLTLSIEELVAASLSGRRDEPNSFEGLGTIAGDTVHECHPKGIGYLLRSWFGAPTSVNRTGSYEHQFIPATSVFAQNCHVPPYTLEVHRDLGGSTPAFQFTGCAANTLGFSMGVGAKILTATAGWLIKDVVNIAATSPTLPTTEPFRWHQCKVGIGTNTSGTASGGASNTLIDSGASWTPDEHIGRIVLKSDGTSQEVRRITDNDDTILTVSPNWTVAAAVSDTYEVFNCPDIAETIEFSLDNGLIAIPTLNFTKRVSRIIGDAFRMGTSTLTVIPEDKTDFETYYKGWTTRRWLFWLLGSNITGDHYYEMFFLFPKVLMTAYPYAIGGGGRLTVAIAAKFKYDSTETALAKAWLMNNTASY